MAGSARVVVTGYPSTIAELNDLRRQRQAVIAYLDARAAQAAEPPAIPPPPWVVEIRALLGVAS